MRQEYAGVLGHDDPMYRFVTDVVLGGMSGAGSPEPVYDVFRLDHRSTVFRYRERQGRADLAGKFYANKDAHDPAARMRREFDNLHQVRALGLDVPPHMVVRPLGVSEELNCVLVEEYVPGDDLGMAVGRAVSAGGAEGLRHRLSAVAAFLAELHNRSQTAEPVDEARRMAYLDKLLGQLVEGGLVSPDRRHHLQRLGEVWASSGALGPTPAVRVHGDATPPHFLFPGDHCVTVIDLERSSMGDRAADLGRLVAELKHLFLRHSGDAWSSEPFIRHLYASYAGLLPAGGDDLARLSARGQFHMGCDLLRIARNTWLDLAHRRRLIEEAEACLAR